jgi:hypothetical protein
VQPAALELAVQFPPLPVDVTVQVLAASANGDAAHSSNAAQHKAIRFMANPHSGEGAPAVLD